MQQDEFLSIQDAVKRLAKVGQSYSADSIRSLIHSGQLPCAVCWLTRRRWLYVDPMNAAHHETNGWPEWAADRTEDVCPSEDNPNPTLIFFTDDKDQPNLNDRVGRPRPGGSGGLNLANFQIGLFIPAAAIDALASESEPARGKLAAPPRPEQTGIAQVAALLAAIREAGYEPEALPNVPNGLPGVPSEMRKALVGSPLFQSDNVVKKAWAEAARTGQIKYRT